MNASLNLFVLKLSSLKINLLFSCLYIDLLHIIFCLTQSNLQLFLKPLKISFLNYRSDINLSTYKSYPNLYNRVLHSSKILYFETQLLLNEKDPKVTWKIRNESLNRSPSKSSDIKEVKVYLNLLLKQTPSIHSFLKLQTKYALKLRSQKLVQFRLFRYLMLTLTLYDVIILLLKK